MVGTRAFEGKWKLVSAKLGEWELYDMAADRTELHDLSAAHPDRVSAMAAEWFSIAREKERLAGRHVAPVRETVTRLEFRKDTSSGSVVRQR